MLIFGMMSSDIIQIKLTNKEMKQIPMLPIKQPYRKNMSKSVNQKRLWRQQEMQKTQQQNLYIKSPSKQAQATETIQIGERVISNKMRGNKIYMSQYRQKQQLKHHSINHNLTMKTYLHNVFIDDNLGLEQFNDLQTNPQYLGRSNRPKTVGFFGSDHNTLRNLRKKRQNTQHFKNNNIMLSNNVVHPRSITYNCSDFKSQNLDTKMNQYMNYYIKTEGKNIQQSEKIINQIQTQGMLPHSRRLNNFERKMKIRNKRKSLSHQKMQKTSPSITVANINKTIQLMRNQNISPLVAQLQYKTIFGPLSNNKSTKPSFFNSKN